MSVPRALFVALCVALVSVPALAAPADGTSVAPLNVAIHLASLGSRATGCGDTMSCVT